MNVAALLIDFEHLVAGLTPPGRVVDGRALDPPLHIGGLLEAASAEGQLAVARAYADWRLPAYARHAPALEARDVSMRQVGGPHDGATLSVRLAVDATGLVADHPEIDAFVLVAPSRALTPLVQDLRARGKRVIGISPARSGDDAIAASCDRFFTYAAATEDGGWTSAEAALAIAELKARLALLLADHAGPAGLLGSRLKPLIRRHILATFDEADYGYAKFTSLLRAMPDVVRIEHRVEQGEIYVFPALGPSEVAGALGPRDRGGAAGAALERFVSRARERLLQWRFEWDRARRHALLAALHGAMTTLAPFTQDDIVGAVRRSEAGRSMALSTTVAARYLVVCYQSMMFEVDERDRDLPVRARRLSLREPFTELDAFVARYEQSILYKLDALLPEDPQQAARLGCAVLGLEAADGRRATYVLSLLERVRR
jgi:hypothetical protein